MKQPLKQSVRDHYQNQQLDAEQLDQLEQLINQSSITQPKEITPATNPTTSYGKQNTRRYIPAWIAAAAASVLLAITLLFLYLPQNNEQRIMAIAMEVAKEHLHQNPLEVNSNDFSTVQRYFSKLDFLPGISSRFGQARQLLGGRYCSIRNITAAQIRYANPGTPNTLYQVSYDPEHFGQIPDIDKGETIITRHVKGITLEMWVEKGLLMVGAKSSDG
ncbi:MAG: hypothetical protein ACPGSM_13005 [Thiolinea sp.]